MSSESLRRNKEFYKSKRVLITGHTGFKGTWLAAILNYLEAETFGIALEAPRGGLHTRVETNLAIKSRICDICDEKKLLDAVENFKPEIILHLAAFGFVNECFNDPVRAYMTNVIGTQNLLEAVRKCRSVKSVVLVSTDKVYENHGDGVSYNESDALGGTGPYAGSKTCMEILANDYRETYFTGGNRLVGIATVRASNVLGGGDHIESRLIPSILRAVASGRMVELRNPEQTRPWQSVFDALNGYLTVGRLLYENPANYSRAWNIGPKKEGIKTVEWVLNTIENYFYGIKSERSEGFAIKESATLGLDINNSMELLDWEPILSVEKTIELVVQFYKRQFEGEPEYSICMSQISNYYGGSL